MPEFAAEVNNLRTPPQAIDVEQAVLCAMMLDKEAIAQALEMIDETYFYKDAHRTIFTAIVELFDRHEAADLYTITELLPRYPTPSPHQRILNIILILSKKKRSTEN